MTYEEKLERYRKNGEIEKDLVMPEDYCRFIRDGALEYILYRDEVHKESTYEVQCIAIPKPDPIPEDVLYSYLCYDVTVIENFLRSLVKAKNNERYMCVDNDYYLIHAELVEVYE